MKKLLSVLSVFVFAAIAADTASASPIIYTPAGLATGDRFRTVFVTSTRTNAQSNDVSTYDTLVTTDANGATYNGSVISWQAIVSTGSINARSHINILFASQVVPLYLVDGTQISAGYLWSGSLLHAIDRSASGALVQDARVWTGTTEDGYGSITHASDTFYFHLGDTAPNDTVAFRNEAFAGRNNAVNREWIAASMNFMSEDAALYGISEILTVSVPEPSTVMLAGLGGLAALAYSFKRKRN